MADKQKPRKSHPGHQAEPNWRNKQNGNTSTHRYRREVVLEKFLPSESFPIPVPEDIRSVFMAQSELPANKSDKFVHGLGDSVSSRKFVPRERNEKVPHHESSKKMEEEVKNTSEAKPVEEKKEFSEIWDAHEDQETGLNKTSQSERSLRIKDSAVASDGKKEEKHEESREKTAQDSRGILERQADKGNLENKQKDGAEKKSDMLAVKNETSGKPVEKQEKKNDKKINSEKPQSDLKPAKGSKKEEKFELRTEVQSNKTKIEENTEFNLPKPNPLPQKTETRLTKTEDLKKSDTNKAKSTKKLEFHPDTSKGSSEPQQTPENKKKPESLKKPIKNESQVLLLKDKQSEPSPSKEELPPTVADSEPKPADHQAQVLPSYPKSVLLAFIDQGSPFARILLSTGLEDQKNDSVSFPAGLKVYQRLWFYKDLKGVIQGPFSCLEMFEWVIRGHFPEDLSIAFCNNEFSAMKKYESKARKVPKVQTNPTPGKEEVKVLKGPWGDSSKLFSNKK